MEVSIKAKQTHFSSAFGSNKEDTLPYGAHLEFCGEERYDPKPSVQF